MELANTMAVLGTIRHAYVNRCPNGLWSFVGSVDIRLAYEHAADGRFPTDAEAGTIGRSCSPYATAKGMGFKRRLWPTKEAATAEADRLGIAWRA